MYGRRWLRRTPPNTHAYTHAHTRTQTRTDEVSKPFYALQAVTTNCRLKLDIPDPHAPVMLEAGKIERTLHKFIGQNA